ncbi:MAG: nucleotidyl transferase AbiEii/AbiGii toxin family protein, partial [Gammaproteobacteria bacterium]|nr:nucleotidyl transferase AbiEii/AbiGii toxin family protein [Gammaproteobacteria bacterium]
MQRFSPNLDALSEAQRQLWDELGAVPDAFTLYGGTAIALQLGHRTSVYFDFFGHPPMDVTALVRALPFLAGGEIVERQKCKLTARVHRGAPVTVSFVGVTRLPRFAPRLVAGDNGLKVDSLL